MASVEGTQSRAGTKCFSISQVMKRSRTLTLSEKVAIGGLSPGIPPSALGDKVMALSAL